LSVGGTVRPSALAVQPRRRAAWWTGVVSFDHLVGVQRETTNSDWVGW